jgi:hypothetical protein
MGIGIAGVDVGLFSQLFVGKFDYVVTVGRKIRFAIFVFVLRRLSRFGNGYVDVAAGCVGRFFLFACRAVKHFHFNPACADGFGGYQRDGIRNFGLCFDRVAFLDVENFQVGCGDSRIVADTFFEKLPPCCFQQFFCFVACAAGAFGAVSGLAATASACM